MMGLSSSHYAGASEFEGYLPITYDVSSVIRFMLVVVDFKMEYLIL